jgi:CBS domain containing-hemolysin-like protein
MSNLPVSPFIELLLILFFIITSAAYTAAEVAISRLLRMTDGDEEQKDTPAGETEIPDNARELQRAMGSLLDRPRLLSATFIMGRVVMRVMVVIIVVLVAFRWPLLLAVFDPRWLLTGSIVTAVLLVVILTELLPRATGTRWPNATLAVTAPLVRVSGLVFFPFAALLARLLKAVEPDEGPEAAFETTEELRHLLEERQGEGKIEAEDVEMIEDLLEFGQTMAREVMVPRIDIVALSVEDDFARVRQIVRETAHSRLPLYKGDIDHVIGLIHTKDLLRQPEGEEVPLRELARTAPFVPETKMIDDLLREMQHTKTHMAIVVDEYGGTAGLVTLEDLIEEIVGEIQDEYDSEAPLIKKLESGALLMDAMVSLEEFQETVGIEIPTNGYDTLGGFLYSLEGHVPEKGQELTWEELHFIIRETLERRILKVEVSIRPEQLDTGEGSGTERS